MNGYRRASAAGMFYPSDVKQLKELIHGLLYFGKSNKKIDCIGGIVAPHAGYIYSGKTAAFAYNLIKDRSYKTVIIISPSHREYFEGICIYDGEGYTTPLGNVTVNHELADKLIEGSKYVFKGLQGHKQEHAVEVHIPFLQYVMKDFDIVPVVMGDQSKKYVDELADQLAKVYNEDILMVASTDLSHFHSKAEARTLDTVVEKDISSYNYEILMEDLENNKCEACGGGPVAAMMKALDKVGINKSMILDRSDSGDVTRDNTEVVGYLSAVIYS